MPSSPTASTSIPRSRRYSTSSTLLYLREIRYNMNNNNNNNQQNNNNKETTLQQNEE